MTKEEIKEWLSKNLILELDSETSDFMTTDGSSATRVTATVTLDGEIITEDSITHYEKH